MIALERVRAHIEAYVYPIDRQYDVWRQVEIQRPTQTISSVTATGQWSEALGRSQPARGKRSTS
jgi:hypothetical protein